jgi:dTDP-4-dehydrorhamnose 3,5-epimerase
VEIRPLSIPHSFEVENVTHGDPRGEFTEWYRGDKLEAATGFTLPLKQSNISVSSRGVFRGIHFADVPPGQAKYITVPSGSAVDFVIDLRVGSPTFGQWDTVVLSAAKRNAVFIAEGLGHAFLALEDGTTACYLVSELYNPAAERTVSIHDTTIGLDAPIAHDDVIVSERDATAPTLAELTDSGLLPRWEVCNEWYSARRAALA